MTDGIKSSTSEIPSLPEIGFYYPGWIWRSDTVIKNLILYFDGIAVLVPDYMRDRFDRTDEAITLPLQEKGLLHILEPETIVDKSATEKLADAMVGFLETGALDELSHDKSAFHELSYSRMGGHGNLALAEMLLEELKKRNLAKDSEDGVSIPMHPTIRSLILVLLAQILRPHGKQMGLDFSPLTDQWMILDSLTALLKLPKAPSSGHVVQFDMETLGVDLAGVPMDEVLSFRDQYRKEHAKYTNAVKRFTRELSLMPPEERQSAFEQRQEEIIEIASDIRRISRISWKRPATFAMAIAGAAWTITTGDPMAALLGLGGALIPEIGETSQKETGAYSYIFEARRRF